jgi:hypothetical protein
MIEIEKVRPGQHFTLLGVEYKMLRIEPGTHKQLCRNQWGRAEGGTYDAISVCVKVNRHHKGWWFSKVAFRPGQMVFI